MSWVKWKPRKLRQEANQGLPVPRLEIRYRPYNDHEMVADYGLVYEHLLGETYFVTLGSTKIGGGRVMEEGHLDLPFRDGAHIVHDMWHLKLRGFVVNGRHIKEVQPTEDDYPGAMISKIKKIGR